MIKKLSSLIIPAFILVWLIIGCGKKEEYQTGEVAQKEGLRDDQHVETIKPKSINYDSMFVIISQLVDSIKNDPNDIELRRQLVAASYDTTWETILAAGTGKRMENAETESVAMKYAERAAAAEAYRWAVYIKRWSLDPTFPDIGYVNAEIQGRVVAKRVLPDKNVSVMVEVHISKIP